MNIGGPNVRPAFRRETVSWSLLSIGFDNLGRMEGRGCGLTDRVIPECL